ncbi:MAG: hypothetical protein V4506_09990 [Bacteroidota bacterium]
MKRILVVPILFALAAFVSCKPTYPEELYGTYENIDSFHILFTKMSFHRNHIYTFDTWSCMDGTHDSGEFYFDNGTITFHSFLPIDTVGHKFDKRLSNYNFIYKPGKVYFLKATNPLLKDKRTIVDTLMNITKNPAIPLR